MDSLSATLAAVADPTRRSILQRLAAGPAPVRDLVRPFRISQQAISKHIALLVDAKLISKRREGRLQICTLEAQPLEEVAGWAESYRRSWEQSFARLDDVLDELKRRDRRSRTRDRGTRR